MGWLKARWNEINTWQGVSLLATLLGLNFGPDVIPALTSTWGLGVQFVTALIALIAIIKKQVVVKQ